jgi:hypothetical protein
VGHRARPGLEPKGAKDLFSKLRKVQEELELVRRDFVENPDDQGRRDDYMLMVGSAVRLSLSLCRLLQSELELLRRSEAARISSGSRKRRLRMDQGMQRS